MKRALFITISLLTLATAAGARENTLIDQPLSFGGFGGPTVLYTRFNGGDHWLVGGQGAFLAGHTFYVGGGGYGLVSRPAGPGTTVNNLPHDSNFEGGYGGVLLGAVIMHESLVHGTADVMIGGGSVANVPRHWESMDDEWDYRSPHDEFFMVQPMAHAELNVTTWMRLDAGAGYRFVTGVTEFGLDNEDASGVVAGLTFRFGRF